MNAKSVFLVTVAALTVASTAAAATTTRAIKAIHAYAPKAPIAGLKCVSPGGSGLVFLCDNAKLHATVSFHAGRATVHLLYK